MEIDQTELKEYIKMRQEEIQMYKVRIESLTKMKEDAEKLLE
jgi:hypothetical protein